MKPNVFISQKINFPCQIIWQEKILSFTCHFSQIYLLIIQKKVFIGNFIKIEISLFLETKFMLCSKVV